MFLDYPSLYGYIAQWGNFNWDTLALIPEAFRVLIKSADHDETLGTALYDFFLEKTPATALDA